MSEWDDRSGRTAAMAGDSLAVASWTLVSRLTGFLRAVIVAAVLGPTYLGNIFQSTNLLPNLAFEFLTGSLFASLLVPALVRQIDEHDAAAVRRVANGFLGITTSGFLIVTVAGIVGAPLLLKMLSSGVDPTTAVGQERVGLVLMALLMPQVVLYGLAATGAAVQNAHGRFALPAAAPAVENVGLMITLAAVHLLYGGTLDVDSVQTPALILLGGGTTLSVALHAALQWVGAYRVGVTLIPSRSGWRDPQVRDILSRLRPSLGYAGLNSLRVFIVLVVANRVPGGVVAFTLALNFLYLPSAVFARPIAVALLPRLSRLRQTNAMNDFRTEVVRGTAMALLLVVPTAVALLVLAEPLARAVAFGQMATTQGRSAVAVSLAALAAGVVGEAVFILATHASYALGDARAPYRAMVSRTIVAVIVMAAATLLLHDQWLLLGLGVAISLSNVCSAVQLFRSVFRQLPVAGERMLPPLLRIVGATLAMVVPAYGTAAAGMAILAGRIGEIVSLLGAAIVGGGVFVGTLYLAGSPELRVLLQSAQRRRSPPGGVNKP